MDSVRVGKLFNGDIVEVLKVQESVGFSQDRGWILIGKYIGDRRGLAIRWIPSSTQFIWIKNFLL